MILNLNFAKNSSELSGKEFVLQNSQAVKKECAPKKGYGEKGCEIQGGSQEMAVMVARVAIINS